MANSRDSTPLSLLLDCTVRNAARTPGALGINDQADPTAPAMLGDTPGSLGVRDHADPTSPKVANAVLAISGIVAAGLPLSQGTIVAINEAAAKTPKQWRRYIAYESDVNVGGSLAWRANNPGNLRDAPTKINVVSGAVGKFAVFATLDEGRAAQRSLYLDKYGSMTVRAAINKLTPPSENDTAAYLAKLKDAGIDLDKDVKSQIDALMPAVAANEGLITGTVVARVP